MTKLINKLKSFLPSGLDSVSVTEEEKAEFILFYKSLEIGVLKLEDGLWHFSYSDAFKAQSEISPIPDFPNVDKEYQKEELWPFFLIRIPSLKQPKVQKIISKNHIDPNSQVELLKFFGKKTIANPFELKSGLT